jgi:hypothetical protein
MSDEAIKYVLEKSTVRDGGAAFWILLVLAYHSDDQGICSIDEKALGREADALKNFCEMHNSTPPASSARIREILMRHEQ